MELIERASVRLSVGNKNFEHIWNLEVGHSSMWSCLKRTKRSHLQRFVFGSMSGDALICTI